MKKSMKRTAVAGVAVLMAGASIAGGATVTAAAIDSGDTTPAPDSTVVVQQISQDADGNWFSCEQELGLDPGPILAPAGGPAGTVGSGIMITASAGVAPISAGDAPSADGSRPVEVSGTLSGIAVAVSGDAGTIANVQGTGPAIALPTPDEIRPGTTDECNALQGK